MHNVKRSWDLISDEKRKESIQAIIDFFKTKRKEEIGIIAAEEILDYILQYVATDIYNKGVEDSRNLLKSRLEDFEIDLSSLLKSK